MKIGQLVADAELEELDELNKRSTGTILSLNTYKKNSD